MSIPFLYQLQGASRESLAQVDFVVGVVDMDDTGMTRRDVDGLEADGKTLFTYLSIGEAEEYRDYWSGIAGRNFVLSENPDWDGNHRVAFWDTEWQEIMLGRVTEAVEKGYSGMYLDIVDGYLVDEVQAAYDGADIRQEMIDFVLRLSEHAKSLDPDFIVIPQNAVELLAGEGGAEFPNATYLAAIDGIGVEDLFYDDNTAADWTPWDLEYIRHAQNAGKFVLATSYPTDDAKQADFVKKAVAEGLVPFVGTRSLDGTVDRVNASIDVTIPPGLDGSSAGFGDTGSSTDDGGETGGGTGETVTEPPEDMTDQPVDEAPTGDASYDPAPIPEAGDDGTDPSAEPPKFPADPDFSDREVIRGGSASETLRGDAVDGGSGDDTLRGTRDGDVLAGGDGLDILYGRAGDDRLYGQNGHDELRGGSGDDQLAAGSGHDELLGGRGNDLLVGGRGYDVLRGGDGHDRLVADDLDPLVDGGEGFDTLAPGVDSFVIDGRALIGIEAVDLRGPSASALEIDAAAILEITDAGRLVVHGDAGDSVTADVGGRSGFREIDGNSYALFSSEGAEVLLQVGMTLNGDLIEIA